MRALLTDVRQAARSLRRTPGFTAGAVLTLALGIGASTAIFSVVHGVLLRPAPFDHIDRLAMIWETDRNSGTSHEPASIPDVADFRERSRSFASIAAFAPVEVNATAGNGDPERLSALGVTANYFETVGLSVTAGRTFRAEEDLPGGPRVVVISEELWRRRYQRDAAITGRTIRLNDVEWQIAGVLPQGADFGVLQVLGSADYQRAFADRGGRPRVDVWLPLRASPAAPRNNHPIFVLGRLAESVSAAAAQQEMTSVTADLERQYPQDNAGRGALVQPLSDVVFGPVRTAMLVLVAAVGLVLLVACGNVANLLVVRAAQRGREVAVRTALGAGIGRLARQFLAEAAWLVAAGGALGSAVAVGAVRLLASLAPPSIPRVDEMSVDGTTLAVTAALSIAVTLAAGLVPTLQARRVTVTASLGAGARGASGGRGQRLVRRSLVVAELAMATTLMIGAGLLIRSLATLQSVDPGFDAGHVLKAEFQLPAARYPQDFSRWPDWPERRRFQREVEARLAAAPGVEAVALATANPMDAGSTSSIRVVGREAEARGWPEPSIRTVSAGYFGTMRVPITAGRGFESTDTFDGAAVAIVNEAARDRYFDGRDPLGSEITLWGANRRVVGVAGNERFKGLAASAPPAVYLPLDQAPTPNAVLVRMSGDAWQGAPILRAAVREIDPQLALFGVEPLTDTISGTMAERRFTMAVLASFAGVALLLAVVGVHGVLSYAVSQRTREIGIRVALGADAGRVRTLVLREGVRLAAAGLAIGLAGAAGLTRLMRALLFGVSAQDPATFVGVGLMLGLVAVMACWLPARRAARVDPAVSLRGE
jgi:putative ABC transport system permease protein